MIVKMVKQHSTKGKIFLSDTLKVLFLYIYLVRKVIWLLFKLYTLCIYYMHI
jgi:hypothetical protein